MVEMRWSFTPGLAGPHKPTLLAAEGTPGGDLATPGQSLLRTRAYRERFPHAGYVDADQVATLRALMSGSRWLEQARSMGRALRTSPRSAGGLLVVGTPEFEPWHMTAHLDDESRLSGVAELAPTLVRWSPPPGAPPHLSVGLARLEAARRGETLFVVAEDKIGRAHV